MTDHLVVTSADGATFKLLIDAAAGTTCWLYWCPAMGVSARQYRLFADAMAQRGIGIATHEWRGAGSSDRRASRRSDWGYRELLADIDAGVAGLRASQRVDRLAIGGHSLGAQLAALALARDPELADAFVLVGSGLPWWRAFPWWQRPILFAVFAWFRALSAICGWFPGRRVGFAGDEARGVIRDWSRSGISGRYRAQGLDTDFDAALRQLEKPGWSAHLHDDRFAPMSSTAALQARMPKVSWQLMRYVADQFPARQATHFSWMKEAGPIADDLRNWLRDRSAGRA